AKVAKAQKKYTESVAKLAAVSGGALIGGVLAVLLGGIASFFAALLFYGVGVPLTKGAITLCTADLVNGGSGDWRIAWSGLLKRLPTLWCRRPIFFLAVCCRT